MPPHMSKWLHSVTLEPDFVSEWEAVDKAHALAFSLHGAITCPVKQVSNRLHQKNKKPQHVSFSEVVQVVLGSHEGTPFFEFDVPMESLYRSDKPWTLDLPSSRQHSPACKVLSETHNSRVADVQAYCTPQASIQCTPSQLAFDLEQCSRFASGFVLSDETDRLPGRKQCEVNISCQDITQPFLTVPQTWKENMLTDRNCKSNPNFAVSEPNSSTQQNTNKIQLLYMPNTHLGTNFASSNGDEVASLIEFPNPQRSKLVKTWNEDFRFANPNSKNIASPQARELYSDNLRQDASSGEYPQNMTINPGSSLTNCIPSLKEPYAFRHSWNPIGTQIAQDDVHTDPHQHVSRDSRLCTDHMPTDDKFQISVPAATQENIARSSYLQPDLTCNHSVSASDQNCTLRLNHESPIAHLRDPSPSDDPDDASDEEEEQDDEPVTPRYIYELASRIRIAGLNPYEHDFDLAVRTWFIDHSAIHRWTAPRLLQLTGPPHGWAAQITSIWVDQINPNDWFEVAIVAPDPPRPPEHSYVVFDLIGVQSVTLPRLAALVTVIPGHPNLFPMFSVACSLPELVSGYEIVNAADAGSTCRHRQCTITQRWNQIPNTMRPQHQVGNGDSYQIAVHPPPSIPSGAPGPDKKGKEDPGLSSTAASSSSTINWSNVEDADPDHEGTVERYLFATILHIFQLSGPEVSIELVNQQIIQPTQAIADGLNIPFDTLEALHVMTVHPQGLPDYHTAAVVQRVGDIPIRSTDRLLLLDIEYRHQKDSEGNTPSPTLVREVIRISFLITRQQLLMSAGVFHYCQMLHHQDDTCLVHFNSLPWPVEDAAPRPVQHGAYAHIVIPPPIDHDVPVETAVQVVQTVGEHPEQFAAELADLLHSDDETTLMQLCPEAGMHVSGRVETRIDKIAPDPIQYFSHPRHCARQNRLEHESPVDPTLIRHDETPDDTPQNEPPNQGPPELPAFATSLVNRLMRYGIDSQDENFELELRTWYLDHETVQRWTAPRLWNLAGPPSGWEDQIKTLWIDQLDPASWFAVTIVEPDPPRPPQHRRVVYDIIVEQGLQLPRFACLVTVMPSQVASFDMFSVACSLPGRVAGYDVIHAADAGPNCMYRSCTITYRWQEIPNTLRPTHDVGHGDGFQIVVHEPEVGLGPPIRSLPNSISSSSSSGSSFGHAPRQNPAAIHAVMQHPAHQFTTVLHLHSLHNAPATVTIVNDQLVLPTQAIAAALHIPYQQLEALHVVPFYVVEVPAFQVVAVVQQVGDVDIGTTDRLLLIDTIYHHSDLPGPANRPTVTREVHRVGHVIIRNQLLQMTALHHQCHTIATQCTVVLDDRLWPIDEADPRPVRFGSYAQINVLPVHEDTQASPQLPSMPHQNHQIEVPDAENTIFPPNDETSWIQTSSVRLETRKPVHFFPPDFEDCVSKVTDFTPTQEVESTPGAVLQPKVELNPRCSSHPKIEPGCSQTATVMQRTPAPLVSSHMEKSTKNSSVPTGRDNSGKANEPQANSASNKKQKSIKDFFAKHKSGKSSLIRKQSCITEFFKPKSTVLSPLAKSGCPEHRAKLKTGEVAQSPSEMTWNQHDADTIDLSTKDYHEPATIVKNALPKPDTAQAKCNQNQETPAPQFVQNIPLPPQPGRQRQRPRPIWQLELASRFDELAVTTHAVTGPELVVEVWYIHHHAHPECTASRTVRLDNIAELWYADLCTAWWDRIQRTEPLKVLVVKPPPAVQLRTEARLHIVLEQGMQPHVVAILLTAVFHGDTRDGVLQQAESVPDAICTADIIEKHNFQPYCQFRPCSMFSGRLRFQQDVREEIFSGMSAHLNIGDPHALPASATASSSNALPPQVPNVQWPEDDSTHLMQLPNQVTRIDAASILARRPRSPPVPGSTRVTVQRGSPTTPPSLHRIIHPMTVTVANHLEFQQTLHWHNARTLPECSLQMSQPKRISTWFSHPEIMPRTDHPKDVLLSSTPFMWVEDIIQAWSDWIDVEQPVHLHVVQPPPPGGHPEIIAHVIVLQKPTSEAKAAIVSVTETTGGPLASCQILYIASSISIIGDDH